MDNKLFTQTDVKIYKCLANSAKADVKKLFQNAIMGMGVRMGSKTVQRLFSNPQSAPENHQEVMLDCLRQVVEREKQLVQFEISQVEQYIEKRKQAMASFDEYLSKFTLIL